MKTGFEFASSKIVDDVMCQSCRLRNPVVSNTIKFKRYSHLMHNIKWEFFVKREEGEFLSDSRNKNPHTKVLLFS